MDRPPATLEMQMLLGTRDAIRKELVGLLNKVEDIILDIDDENLDLATIRIRLARIETSVQVSYDWVLNLEESNK